MGDVLCYIFYVIFVVIFFCGVICLDCRILIKGMGDVLFGIDFWEGGFCVEIGIFLFSVLGKLIFSKL